MPRRSLLPYLVLASGVLIVSTASIMIRLAQAQGVSSLGIAAGRLGLAALILAPIALLRVGGEIRALRRADLALGLASGAFLALHFASWISSLEYTSVASSAALVSTNSLWVGLASLLIFRERLAWGTLVGIGLTLLGTLLIGLSDSSSSFSNPLLGNGLALLGAVSSSAYLLIGRNLRGRLSLLAYIWLVYTTAAVVLLACAVLSGQQLLGHSPLAYLLLLGLAIGPQLLGHSSFNWALSSLSATFVAVSILGEPIGSAIMALVFFQEGFAPLQLLGFAVLLSGILVAAVGEHRAQPTAQQEPVIHRRDAESVEVS